MGTSFPKTVSLCYNAQHVKEGVRSYDWPLEGVSRASSHMQFTRADGASGLAGDEHEPIAPFEHREAGPLSKGLAKGLRGPKAAEIWEASEGTRGVLQEGEDAFEAKRGDLLVDRVPR